MQPYSLKDGRSRLAAMMRVTPGRTKSRNDDDTNKHQDYYRNIMKSKLQNQQRQQQQDKKEPSPAFDNRLDERQDRHPRHAPDHHHHHHRNHQRSMVVTATSTIKDDDTPRHALHLRTPTRPPQSSRINELVSPPIPRRLKCPPLPESQFPVPSHGPQFRMVGPASLGIFRLSLPPHLLSILDHIVTGCEAHAATLSRGWFTDLYSLTKQDIALRKTPHLYRMAKPIVEYMAKAMLYFWNVNSLYMDRNQPHVLKYDKDHVGVQLHHDKCDITANLCMSRSNSYVGGGTYFPEARETVRLEFGEFILHPGSLIHSGSDISSGLRHLMVVFADVCF